MGAPLDSENMGCLALSYSLLSCLEAIKKDTNEEITYVVFDWKCNKEKMKLLCQKVGIPEVRLEFGQYSVFNHPLKMAYHFARNIRMIRDIKKCDCVIDLTEGDSFSDIYGDEWFRGRTRVKLLITKLHKPLLLGPQTYGPFIKKNNYDMAKKAILAADFVMTRDDSSLDIVEKIGKKDAVNTSDLAFSLPYCKKEINSEKIKVGINASRLLADNTEMKHRNFDLSLDYLKYVYDVIEYLLDSKIYDIYLISHVSGDYAIHEMINKKYQDTNLIPVFNNPIDAKSFISGMDVFIGARMHGTIGAYSSGVPCIATAYSPKFKNLFQVLDYNYVVDLTELDNDTAFNMTKDYIQEYKKLGETERLGNEKKYKMVELTKQSFAQWIKHVKNLYE